MLAALCGAVSAQSAASSLTGHVSSDGSPAAGVTVTVASPALLGVRTTSTGPGGDYFFRALPPGIYDVEFAKEGFQTMLRRAELQVAETTRVDTAIAKSDVEETVTSTTVMPTLLEMPQLSTPIDAATVDRLPIGRSVRDRLLLAPGLPPRPGLHLIDSIVLDETVADAIAESTFISGFLPSEYGSERGQLFATVTCTGGPEVVASLRSTAVEGGDSLVEGSAGGPVIENRLWFFGATNNDASLIKMTGDVLENHTVTLGRHDDSFARYDGAIGSRATVEALSAADQWSAKGHIFISTEDSGNHSLLAGVEDLGDDRGRAFFFNDVWRGQTRWAISAGVRSSDERPQPRLGGVYDFRGDGEHRLSASWARYALTDEATVSYGWRFGTGGYARADYIRRQAAATTNDVLQLHGSYDLFRIFRFGGNYTASIRGAGELRRRGNGWFWYEPAVGDGTMTLSILQRYLASATETFFSTDIGGMYAYPVRNVTAFAKVDLINAFDRPLFSTDELAVPRTWRASVGARF